MEIRNGRIAGFCTFSVKSDKIELQMLRTIHEDCKTPYSGVFH